ncbi:MAG: TIGR02281 family clan AA aspartic protease [Gammaproteobacteria bacterium]|nr:MAG: TIGR02281 family clan AA aspartic protease [Gammaproteobacteria bacterium]
MNAYRDNPESRIGRRMIWLAALVLLAGLYALFSALEEDGGTVISIDAGGAAMIVLEQDRNGHYQVQGKINNQPVNFLVDTGATDVAVPESMARALGLKFGPPVKVMTAAGPSKAWMTRLNEVSIGGISRRDVRATITSGEFSEVLLGMSFLRHYSLRQQDGKLVISEGLSDEQLSID